MFQHEESDEDDYEGYFLKPVNGYNIADRIKSANKELFDDDSVQSGDCTEPLRKVSFRPEPDYEPSDPEMDDASSCDDEDVEAINQVLDRRDDFVAFEEQKINEMDNDESEKSTSKQVSHEESVTGGDDEIEEICEDIINVELAANNESPQLNEKEDSTDKNPIVEETNVSHNSDDASTQSPTHNLNNEKNLKNRKLLGHHPKSSSAKVRSTESKSTQHHHQNHRPNSSVNTKKSSESQFLKIQLNFKPCCEFKYLENDRLPRYCGYVSQYGLSKEQLEMREKRRERLKERKSDKTAKQLEEEAMKSEVNEEAFARWLQNKMRNGRNMTKNMYDYRPTKQTKKGKKKV